MMFTGSESGLLVPATRLSGGIDSTIGNASPPSFRMGRGSGAFLRCLWPVSVGVRTFSIDVRYELAGFDHDGSVLPDPSVTSLRDILLENGDYLGLENGDLLLQEQIAVDEESMPRIHVLPNPYVGIFTDQYESAEYNNDGEWTTITITVTVQVKGVLEVRLENITTNVGLRVNWDNIQVS
jgi:hypothetical protein